MKMVEKKIDFKKIEKKWQDKWEKKKIFQVKRERKRNFMFLSNFLIQAVLGCMLDMLLFIQLEIFFQDLK